MESKKPIDRKAKKQYKKKNVKKTTSVQPKKELKKVRVQKKRESSLLQYPEKRRDPTVVHISNGGEMIKSQDTMSVSCDIDRVHLTLMASVLASFMLHKNMLAGARASDPGVNAFDINRFVAYLMDSVRQISSGSVYELTNMPRVVHLIAQTLRAKTVPFKQSCIAYSPVWDGGSTDYTLPGNFVTEVGTYYHFSTDFVNLDIALYTTGTATGGIDAYNSMLKVFQNDKIFFRNSVAPEAALPKYLQTASSFARAYGYFGTGGIAGSGLYSNLELEVPIHTPYLSKFIRYDNAGSVEIGKHFAPATGSSPSVIGPMLSNEHFRYRHIKNRLPIVYKFIDFAEIYVVAVATIAEAYNKQFALTPDFTPTTFTFGKEDFLVALRQAVLSVFPSQCYAQFAAPYNTTPTNNSTVFQPFLVDSSTFASETWTDFIIPATLKENLAMLREVQIDLPDQVTGKRENYVHYVPVIGHYPGDTYPDIQYTSPSGVTTSIFGPNIVATSPFNLADGKQSTAEKYNYNHPGFTSVMSSWNAVISQYSGMIAGTGKITPDTNPKATLLWFTRVLEVEPPTEEEDRLLIVPNKFDSMIVYRSRSQMKKQESLKSLKGTKEKLNLVPSAPLTLQRTTTLTSAFPVYEDVFAILNTLIIPTIRLDTAPQITLTLRMYATYTGELSSVNVKNFTTVASTREYVRLGTFAALMVPGQAPTKENNDVIEAIAKMYKEGFGGDILGALLGGLIGSVPVIGPMASTLLGLV